MLGTLDGKLEILVMLSGREVVEVDMNVIILTFRFAKVECLAK